MKKILSQIVTIAVLCCIALLAGCEKDKEQGPALPPLSAFAIDLEDFTSAAPEKSVDTMSNFHLVVGGLSYWNLLLSLSMAIPVAAYAEAFNHDAERVDNDTWQWSYSVNETYSARLTADVMNDSIYLTMFVTKNEVFEDAVWYTGKCDILRTGGEWTVYDIPLESETAWLHIEWNADYEAETFDIKYLNVKPGADYEGSYIEYGITEESDYNAFYNLYNSFTNMLYEVDYNTETHVGTVSDGLNQLCWDENFTNTICGEKSAPLVITKLYF
ncbi:MAG TPA: hypothetical protein VHI78_03695 [Bacteroidales bacterium]|jgi:hypothetical protein|nr:hypothetical protein [Bacteroidales bacterium]